LVTKVQEIVCYVTLTAKHAEDHYKLIVSLVILRYFYRISNAKINVKIHFTQTQPLINVLHVNLNVQSAQEIWIQIANHAIYLSF
jgi:hypothetical protein